MVDAVRTILVIKVGTSTLIGDGEMPGIAFERVARSVAALRSTREIIVVTSGAIGFGMKRLGESVRPTDITELQALATVGQANLMAYWAQHFDGINVGQVLVTARDLDSPDRVLVLDRVFRSMWARGVVPIINENDAISYDEISFGDNDKLAALVASSVGASELVLLTDQDGVQEAYGTSNQRRIEVLDVSEADQHVVDQRSSHGTGGIASKLIAATIAQRHGVHVYIADARHERATELVLAGKVGTKLV